MTTANILRIIRGTTVDGPGFRTSIYFAGCKHQCPGCHNPQSWDFNAGNPMSVEQLIEIIKEEEFDVTLSGGDPLYHPEFIAILCKEIKKLGLNIWIYTGFTAEKILENPVLRNAIQNADTLVDSPFILEMRDPDLRFRGSSNQRILSIPELLNHQTIKKLD